MKRSKIIQLSCIAVIFCCAAIYADYVNVTIPDGRTGNGNLWWKSTNEDNEVEPGMVTGQQWDLEGFFTQGTELSMVSGVDLVKGATYQKQSHYVGDIFVDVVDYDQKKDVPIEIIEIKKGLPPPNELYGYDYVFDMDYDAKTYDVILLTDQSILQKVSVDANGNAVPTSNPYKYISGGKVLYSDLSFDWFQYEGDYLGLTGSNISLDPAYNGKMNNTHYVVTGVDMTKLDLDQVASLKLHTTLSCGNDNLIGYVPEPSSISLLGLGILCLAGFIRSKKRIR